MSNWAKLQEDTIQLPVFKRAKHGIHFKNNDGSITANFSGKPCHYEDGGIWKPIDTKLIRLSDGWYGSPHSDVRIHPDGRVKVEGYQQRAELPSAKVGKADNDKLIREFSFGSQELRITEDGFKSEITLNRIPTLTEARKLIASESGTLSKEYLKSLTTATDANGNVHTVSTLSAFRTWLAKAVFPVVIDPDFSIGNTTYGDTCFDSSNSSTKIRNYGGNSQLRLTINCSVILRFDLTSITGICTAAQLNCYSATTNTNTQVRATSLYSISAANTGWIEGIGVSADTARENEPCWDALQADGAGGIKTAWAGGSNGCTVSGTDYESTLLATVDMPRNDPVNTLYEIVFNESGIARVEDWFGSTNTNYGMILLINGTWNNLYSGEETTETDKRPVLSVTYTASGIAIPVAQYYYNRLRRN